MVECLEQINERRNHNIQFTIKSLCMHLFGTREEALELLNTESEYHHDPEISFTLLQSYTI